MNKINVSVKSFPDLFDKKYRLVIPEYQRPYIWGKDKTEDLLNDLKEHFVDSKSTRNYYMGAILYYFNKKKSTYELIDGQQRITTLLIIQRLLQTDALPDFQNVTYNSHQSVKFIKEANSYFQQNHELLKKMNGLNFLKRLNFTLIITNTEDDAFTFFDTQNNRGIKLGATDFLKAYHLRAIQSEYLQEKCAIQWEKSSAKIFEGPFLTHLFDKILWRARNWRGQKYISHGSQDEILYTFQKKSIKPELVDSYPLYPNFYNRQATGHNFKSNGDLILYISQPEGYTFSDLPFSLRQPLYKGMNFFKYSQKYVAIHELLFHNSSQVDNEIVSLRQFYNTVYERDMSIYLRHFMQLCLVAYYDIFGKQNILEAALCFDYLFGSIRVQKQQVKKEAVSRCLMDNPNNILDVITQAYLPGEVFDFVYNLPEAGRVYAEENIALNDGVRGRYKSRIMNYFDINETTLIDRKSWRRK
jgi:hypothetical protein